MSIRPSKGLDISWYLRSKLLRSSDAAEDFLSLVKRIQQFNRNSTVSMVSGCSWFAWALPPEDPRAKTDLNYIFFRYSLFVGTLALIYCQTEGKNPVDEVDLRILVGELFNIGGLENESDWYIAHEIAPLQTRLKELSQENSYLRKIDSSNDQKTLSSLLLMSRTALVQWDGISFSFEDWIRSALLYEKYREIALRRGFCSTSELDRAERQFIGTSTDRLMKSILILISMFKSSITDVRNPPGAFDPKSGYLPPELETKFDTTNNDLEVVSNRLSIDASELHSKRELLEKIPPKAWLCSKELWTLHDHPFVRLDDMAPHRFIVSVAPQRLLPKCAKMLQQDIVQFYETNGTFNAKQRAYDLKGWALEEYITERSVGTSLERVDPILPKGYKGKRPDFIWVGSDWCILFEVKANIKMNSDQTYFNSASLIDSWKTLTEPIDQAREFVNLGLIAKKRHCLVVVTNDNLCEPMSNFKRVAKYWNFLDKTGIDSLAILSISQLETALNYHSPDSVGDNLQKTWDALDPLSVDGELLDYDFFAPHHFRKEPPEYIAKKWKELFPHFKMEP